MEIVPIYYKSLEKIEINQASPMQALDKAKAMFSFFTLDFLKSFPLRVFQHTSIQLSIYQRIGRILGKISVELTS